MKKINKEVSKYFSKLAKQSHNKKPRGKDFYREMQKKAVDSRMAKKHLSIPIPSRPNEIV